MDNEYEAKPCANNSNRMITKQSPKDVKRIQIVIQKYPKIQPKAQTSFNFLSKYPKVDKLTKITGQTQKVNHLIAENKIDEEKQDEYSFLCCSQVESEGSMCTVRRKDTPEIDYTVSQIERFVYKRLSDEIKPEALIERDNSLKNSLKRKLNSFKSIEIPKIDLNKVILHRIDSKKLNLSKNEVKKPSLLGEYPGKNNKLSFFQYLHIATENSERSCRRKHTINQKIEISKQTYKKTEKLQEI